STSDTRRGGPPWATAVCPPPPTYGGPPGSPPRSAPPRWRSVRCGESYVVGRALLVAGTHSDAGKSVVTAGVCRWLRRRGVNVAPFKAQNMSNNSSVVVDGAGTGGEIGR